MHTYTHTHIMAHHGLAFTIPLIAEVTEHMVSWLCPCIGLCCIKTEKIVYSHNLQDLIDARPLWGGKSSQGPWLWGCVSRLSAEWRRRFSFGWDIHRPAST